MNDFARSACDIRCRDVWPLDQVRQSALMAYRRLEKSDELLIDYPVTMFPGCLVVVYRVAMPVEWARDALRKAEREILGESTQVGMVLDEVKNRQGV